MNPQPTALLFGSFDPIHVGHLAIARHLVDATPCTEAWLVVTPCNPFKAGSSPRPEHQRLEILRAAIADDPRLHASDVEFALPRPSYTLRTLDYLSATHPTRAFHLVIGSDNLRDLPNWWHGDLLLSRYPVYVYPRPEAPLPPVLPTSVTLLLAPLLPVSSTLVREKLARGEDVSALVPPPSLPLITRYYSPIEREASPEKA